MRAPRVPRARPLLTPIGLAAVALAVGLGLAAGCSGSESDAPDRTPRPAATAATSPAATSSDTAAPPEDAMTHAHDPDAADASTAAPPAIATPPAEHAASTPAPRPPRPWTPPRRIISCAPNLTDILFAIGAGDRVVAVDAHSTFPPEAAARPRVGDLFAPDLEAMLRLRPDTIVLVPSNRRVREFFSGRGDVRLVECNDANTLASIAATITELGAAVGAEEGAAALLARHARVVEGVRRSVMEFRSRARMAPVRVLMLFGRQPGRLRDPWVIHPHGYLGELAAMLWTENVVPEDLPLYAQADLERIVRWRPDVILELQGGEAGDDPDAAAARAEALRRDWAEHPVARAAGFAPEVRVVADDALTVPGSRIDRSLAVIAVALRPDIFSGDADALLARVLAPPGDDAAADDDGGRGDVAGGGATPDAPPPMNPLGRR